MSNNTQNCIFKNIVMINQDVTSNMFSELMFNMYNNIIFSTFPYTLYKEEDSTTCLKKYNSGNCIALSYFVKIYLEQNFNIKSYVIGASVPDTFKVKGTPHMSHCAVLIPISMDEFYIFDAAFYFMEPMYCNLKNNEERTIKTSNVYSHQISYICYIISTCPSIILDDNYNQKLQTNSLCVSCYFKNESNEKWNYYLNEIVNPDNNIGISFLENKKEPFLMYTVYHNEQPKLKYKIKVQEDGLVQVKQYPNGDVIFNGESDNFDNSYIKKDIQKYLSFYSV